MFGLPCLPCADRVVHAYHSDGVTYCPGLYEWELTLEDLGHDRTGAVSHPSYASIDAAAREAGVVGGTYATPYHYRGAYVVIDGTLHLGPARRLWESGVWLGPGQDAPATTSLERDGDLAADAHAAMLQRQSDRT